MTHTEVAARSVTAITDPKAYADHDHRLVVQWQAILAVNTARALVAPVVESVVTTRMVQALAGLVVELVAMTPMEAPVALEAA